MTIGLWDGTTDDQSWWTVKLDGVVLPGKTTCEVNASGGGLDEKKAAGNQGAYLNDEGVALSSVKITLLLVNAEDVREFNERVIPLLFPIDKRARRRPMTIEHPSTIIDRIDQVVWEDRSIPVPSARSGQVIVFNLKEYQPPEKTKSSKKRSKFNPELQSKDAVDAQREVMRSKEQANSGGNGPSRKLGVPKHAKRRDALK